MTRDEITAVHDARPVAEPDARAEEQARARLYAEFGRAPDAGPARIPRGWRRPALVWPVATTAGVAATCLAVGLVVAQGGPDGDGTARPGVVTTEGSRSAGVDATTTRTMELAARSVEQREETKPQPHDWLYAKTAGSGDDATENWVRFDGEQSAFFLDGKLMRGNVEYGAGEQPPYRDYEFFEQLPEDPDEARARIYRESKRLDGPGWGDDDARAFAYILELFEDTTTMPPDAQATLYRALAGIPGVEIDRDVVDAAGRHGIGVTRSDGKRSATLILAKDDYRYLGQRYVEGSKVLSDIALVKSGIVSGPGARP